MTDTPPVVASSPATASAATVTDHRPVPRGVLPRGVQTWVMAGLAVGMLAIMLIVGRPDPPARPAASPASAQPPNADRVRDYQDRLRVLETQALQDAQGSALAPGAAAPTNDEPRSPAPQDPIQTDRRRREYESLFASNVVLSRRAESERPDLGRPTSEAAVASRSDPANPSVEQVADAVVRATTRTAALTASSAAPLTQPGMPTPGTVTAPRPDGAPRTPERTDAISAAGPLHRILEGTVIDAVLTNRDCR